MKKLKPPSTAPKDKPFLGDFGWPWLALTVWNSNQGEYVTATLQMCPMKKSEGGGEDSYFENEYEAEKNLKGWIPLPEKPAP